MMPNTLGRAFESIDRLADEGSVLPAHCNVLKALYATGWQDGFVAGPLARLAHGFGVSESHLTTAISALQEVKAVDLRTTPTGDAAVELLSLSRPWVTGDVGLGWWQYYLVDEDAEPADGDVA
jgi:hypothetical protein